MVQTYQAPTVSILHAAVTSFGINIEDFFTVATSPNQMLLFSFHLVPHVTFHIFMLALHSYMNALAYAHTLHVKTYRQSDKEVAS